MASCGQDTLVTGFTRGRPVTSDRHFMIVYPPKGDPDAFLLMTDEASFATPGAYLDRHRERWTALRGELPDVQAISTGE
jgi:hypothetical protein